MGRQGVELVEGDWNDSTAIAAALKGVEGAFVMLPAVWAPSPDYREAKSVTANYVEALTKVAPKAEHYRSSTILQTGNRQWSRQTTSAQRWQRF